MRPSALRLLRGAVLLGILAAAGAFLYPVLVPDYG